MNVTIVENLPNLQLIINTRLINLKSLQIVSINGLPSMFHRILHLIHINVNMYLNLIYGLLREKKGIVRSGCLERMIHGVVEKSSCRLIWLLIINSVYHLQLNNNNNILIIKYFTFWCFRCELYDGRICPNTKKCFIVYISLNYIKLSCSFHDQLVTSMSPMAHLYTLYTTISYSQYRWFLRLILVWHYMMRWK